MEKLKTHYLCRFNRKSGKIDTTLSGLGNALLQMWALQNTTAKSKDTIIFDEDGLVHSYYEGTGNFPKVTRYDKMVDEIGYHHIDEFCEGLLDKIKELN